MGHWANRGILTERFFPREMEQEKEMYEYLSLVQYFCNDSAHTVEVNL